jgi:hypothetical protein
MIKNQSFKLMLIALSLSVSSCAVFQKQDKKDTKTASTEESKKDKDGMKPYAKVIIKDAKSDEGLFTVHKVDEKYFYEIPDSLFNREMLTVTRPLLVFAGIGFGGGRRSNGFSIVCYGIQIIVGLLQGVVAITTSAFACRATCCVRKQNPGAVVFSQITNNGEQTFATITMAKTNLTIKDPLSTNIESCNYFAGKVKEKPPAYDTAAAKQPEDGDKYQRFN